MYNDDQLDRAINEALASYVEEPRTGLEHRVIAHVRTAKPRVAWLRWTLALGATACVLVVIAISMRTAPKPNVVAHKAPVLTPQAVQTPTQRARILHMKRAAKPARRPEPPPKLAQFPSPSPLTDDERTLMALARRSEPRTLQSLAQARQRDAEPIQIPNLQIVEIQIPPLSNGGN